MSPFGPFPIDRDGLVRDYWKQRMAMHTSDRYRGLQLAKLPEDLRTYEHVIEGTRPEFIVELGTAQGGSALWFADRLQTLCGGGKVITIDVSSVALDDERIICLHGDLRDFSRVVAELVGGARTMVIEDSRHDYQTTLDALNLYSGLVTKGCFFVVEDGVVDDPGLTIYADRGVIPAVQEFISKTDRFVLRDMAIYGLTMHMGGWLEAIA